MFYLWVWEKVALRGNYNTNFYQVNNYTYKICMIAAICIKKEVVERYWRDKV